MFQGRRQKQIKLQTSKTHDEPIRSKPIKKNTVNMQKQTWKQSDLFDFQSKCIELCMSKADKRKEKNVNSNQKRLANQSYDTICMIEGLKESSFLCNRQPLLAMVDLEYCLLIEDFWPDHRESQSLLLQRTHCDAWKTLPNGLPPLLYLSTFGHLSFEGYAGGVRSGCLASIR